MTGRRTAVVMAASRGLGLRRTQEGIPIGRYGRADELGAVVAFLASYLTGQSILLDGGLVPHVG